GPASTWATPARRRPPDGHDDNHAETGGGERTAIIHHLFRGVEPMLCRHCQRVKSNRRRGLCWSCYYTPGVRELYPSTSKFARRGLGNFTGYAPLPETPTNAMPGSEEKIQVLCERARLKQALFHPLDSIALPVDK